MATKIPGETWASEADAKVRLNQLLPGTGVIERPAPGFYRRGGQVLSVQKNEQNTWDILDQVDDQADLKPMELAAKLDMIARQQERVDYETEQLQALQAELAAIQNRGQQGR